MPKRTVCFLKWKFGEQNVVSKRLHDLLIQICPFQNVCFSINHKHLKIILCMNEL